MVKGVLQGVNATAFLDISVDGEEKTRKVWWTDKSLQTYLSKICNNMGQKPPLAPEIHSVSWELVTWVLLKNATLWLGYKELGLSSVQVGVQNKRTDNIGITQHGNRGFSVTCHSFVSEAWCKDQTIWQTHSVTYVIIQIYCYYVH